MSSHTSIGSMDMHIVWTCIHYMQYGHAYREKSRPQRIAAIYMSSYYYRYIERGGGIHTERAIQREVEAAANCCARHSIVCGTGTGLALFFFQLERVADLREREREILKVAASDDSAAFFSFFFPLVFFVQRRLSCVSSHVEELLRKCEDVMRFFSPLGIFVFCRELLT